MPSKYKGRCFTYARATLALPADTTYHLIVATRHLFCPKYDLEVSKVQTTSTDFEPGIGDSRLSTMPCTAYYPMTQGSGVCLMKVTWFYYDVVVKTLYHLSYNGILLRYLSNLEAQVIKETHDGICGVHQPNPKLKDRLHRLGYYLLTMIVDAVKYVKMV